jgi:hypothetical protein
MSNCMVHSDRSYREEMARQKEQPEQGEQTETTEND